jgi:hypothetical protein
MDKLVRPDAPAYVSVRPNVARTIRVEDTHAARGIESDDEPFDEAVAYVEGLTDGAERGPTVGRPSRWITDLYS